MWLIAVEYTAAVCIIGLFAKGQHGYRPYCCKDSSRSPCVKRGPPDRRETASSRRTPEDGVSSLNRKASMSSMHRSTWRKQAKTSTDRAEDYTGTAVLLLYTLYYTEADTAVTAVLTLTAAVYTTGGVPAYLFYNTYYITRVLLYQVVLIIILHEINLKHTHTHTQQRRRFLFKTAAVKHNNRQETEKHSSTGYSTPPLMMIDKNRRMTAHASPCCTAAHTYIP